MNAQIETTSGRRVTAAAFAIVASLVFAPGAWAQGARLQLDQLARLSEKAEETVDVSVDSEMLKQTAGFFAGKNADAAKLQSVIADIRGIYVRSFKFAAPKAYSDADIESVRRQVTAPGWSRIVSVRERGELTEIYFYREKDVNGGLAVITAEEDELTVVNIVGRVDLASLGALGPIIPKLPGAMGTALPK